MKDNKALLSQIEFLYYKDVQIEFLYYKDVLVKCLTLKRYNTKLSNLK